MFFSFQDLQIIFCTAMVELMAGTVSAVPALHQQFNVVTPPVVFLGV